MGFQDLYGQSEIKKILTDMIVSDRIGHAYVFCGPEGIGRKSFAQVFAQTIMCLHRAPAAVTPCGCCVGCTLMQNHTNPDYVVISEESGKSTIGVEAVRNMQEDLAKAPEYGQKKVYVIDSAEKLTVQAQNALLKTIEEPPEYAVVILICANISLLIETVRSRVVRLDFARNSDQEVLAAFETHRIQSCAAGETVQDVPKELICAYADGIIGRALEIQDYGLFLELRGQVMEVLQLLPRGKVDFILRFSALFDKQAPHKEFLLFALQSLLRDVMMVARYGAQTDVLNVQYLAEIQQLAGKIGYHRSGRCLEILGEAWTLLGKNVNYKLTVDSTAIRLQEALR